MADFQRRVRTTSKPEKARKENLGQPFLRRRGAANKLESFANYNKKKERPLSRLAPRI